MNTQVEELPESKVRIDAEVDASRVESHIESAAKGMASQMKLPGFRKGKVPPQMVIQRLGRAAVMEEALRHALPEWYEEALIDAGVNPIGDPQLDVKDFPEPGEPMSFSIEVNVLPKATLGEYKGLEVGKPEPEVPEDIIDREVERIQESLSSLSPVDRAAGEGDHLMINYVGRIDGEKFDGGEANDFLLEIGSGTLLPGFEETLTGASAGEKHEVKISFPDDYQADHLQGKDAVFDVEVTEVREKVLPELDDEFAADNSDFDTLDELRSDIRDRLRKQAEKRAEEQFREAVIDAVVAQATITVPEEIVKARATEMWERVERSLSAQGIAPEMYLQMQGRSRDELIEEASEEAEKGVRREAVLAAVAAAEDVEVGEKELLELLGGGEDHDHDHDHEGHDHEGHDHDHDHDPAAMLAQLRESGREGLLISEVQLRRAADTVVDEAKAIPMDQAEAREKLWTPGDA